MVQGRCLQSVRSNFSLMVLPYSFALHCCGSSMSFREYLLHCGVPPPLTLVFPLLLLTHTIPPLPMGHFLPFLKYIFTEAPQTQQLWPEVFPLWSWLKKPVSGTGQLLTSYKE